MATASAVSNFPVSRGDRSIDGYLLKLLVALVKSHGGEVRLSLQDLFEADTGQGIVKHYDQTSRELVLRYVPAEGGEVYLLKDQQPQPSQQPQLQQPRQPTDDLFSAERRPSVLSDEVLAALEKAREDARVMRSVDRFGNEPKKQVPPHRFRQSQRDAAEALSVPPGAVRI